MEFEQQSNMITSIAIDRIIFYFGAVQIAKLIDLFAGQNKKFLFVDFNEIIFGIQNDDRVSSAIESEK